MLSDQRLLGCVRTNRCPHIEAQNCFHLLRLLEGVVLSNNSNVQLSNNYPDPGHFLGIHDREKEFTASRLSQDRTGCCFQEMHRTKIVTGVLLLLLHLFTFLKNTLEKKKENFGFCAI